MLAKAMASMSGLYHNHPDDSDNLLIIFSTGVCTQSGLEYERLEQLQAYLDQLPEDQPAKVAKHTIKHQEKELQVMVAMYSSTQGIAFLEDVLLAILDIEGGWCMYGHEGYTGLSKHQQTDAYAELAHLELMAKRKQPELAW